jgi:hypothetical protein
MNGLLHCLNIGFCFGMFIAMPYLPIIGSMEW